MIRIITIILSVLAVAGVASAQNFQPQPWPQKPWGETEILRAVRGAKTLRNMMRDPDSFVLESASLVLGKNGYDVCYEYRSRNGYGGMNRAQANLTTKDEVRTGDNAWMMSPCGHHKGVTLPDITDVVLERLTKQGGR